MRDRKYSFWRSIEHSRHRPVTKLPTHYHNGLTDSRKCPVLVPLAQPIRTCPGIRLRARNLTDGYLLPAHRCSFRSVTPHCFRGASPLVAVVKDTESPHLMRSPTRNQNSAPPQTNHAHFPPIGTMKSPSTALRRDAVSMKQIGLRKCGKAADHSPFWSESLS